VSDAIVWAAGSMAPSELRAEKPDDVLFAGGGGRPAEDFCEVELLFDNPDGNGPCRTRSSRWPEGSIGAERAVPPQPQCVRRIDLVELLADLGLGAGCTRSSARAASRRSWAQSRRAARPARGGRGPGALQAAQASGRAEAGARRDPGRPRARCRGGGEEALAPAGVARRPRPSARRNCSARSPPCARASPS